MICGNQREFFVEGLLPDTAFKEVAGMHEDNGGGGVNVDEPVVFPVIPTSLLALGNVDGEREELVVLGRVMIIYIVVFTSIIFLFNCLKS
jgi:hypothetical protein